MAHVALNLSGMLHNPGCPNITTTRTSPCTHEGNIMNMSANYYDDNGMFDTQRAPIEYHDLLLGTCICPSRTHFRAMVPNTLMGRGIKYLDGFPPGWVDHNLIFAGRDISRENHTLSQLGGGAQGDEFFIRVALDSPGDDNPEVQDAANAAATAAAAADAADAAAAAAAAAAATAAAPAQGGGKRKYRRKKTKTRYRKRSSRKRKKRSSRRTRRTRLSRSRDRRK